MNVKHFLGLPGHGASALPGMGCSERRFLELNGGFYGQVSVKTAPFRTEAAQEESKRGKGLSDIPQIPKMLFVNYIRKFTF